MLAANRGGIDLDRPGGVASWVWGDGAGADDQVVAEGRSAETKAWLLGSVDPVKAANRRSGS